VGATHREVHRRSDREHRIADCHLRCVERRAASAALEFQNREVERRIPGDDARR
jgi:hypothetical protein